MDVLPLELWHVILRFAHGGRCLSIARTLFLVCRQFRAIIRHHFPTIDSTRIPVCATGCHLPFIPSVLDFDACYDMPSDSFRFVSLAGHIPIDHLGFLNCVELQTVHISMASLANVRGTIILRGCRLTPETSTNICMQCRSIYMYAMRIPTISVVFAQLEEFAAWNVTVLHFHDMRFTFMKQLRNAYVRTCSMQFDFILQHQPSDFFHFICGIHIRPIYIVEQFKATSKVAFISHLQHMPEEPDGRNIIVFTSYRVQPTYNERTRRIRVYGIFSDAAILQQKVPHGGRKMLRDAMAWRKMVFEILYRKNVTSD